MSHFYDIGSEMLVSSKTVGILVAKSWTCLSPMISVVSCIMDALQYYTLRCCNFS